MLKTPLLHIFRKIKRPGSAPAGFYKKPVIMTEKACFHTGIIKKERGNRVWNRF